MIVQRSAMYLGILIVLLVSMRGQTSPVNSKKEDVTYQDSEEFKREILEKIEDLQKNEKKSVFDRILMVNSVHKRWKIKTLEKRNLDTDNIINNINIQDDNVLFEGDMKLNQEQLLDIEKTESFRRKRNAIHKRKQLWTTRQIPYYIDPALSFNARSVIQKAMAIIHEKTCVRWVPYTSTAQKNFVHFKKGEGCFSVIGKAYSTEGAQDLSIGEGCESVSIALHEMTHCMGFYHEQSRDDRERHIKILWENILVAYRDQFAKYSHGQIDKMKKDYDTNSLMHYSSTAFSMNGKATIVPLDPKKTVGEAETYTELDIIEINALYDCKTSSTYQKMSSWSVWSECEEQHCYKERQRFCFSRNKADCPATNVYGIETEYAKCSSLECPAPIDGNWATWSSWGACSKTCDEGEHQRTRICNNPAPSSNGKACIGESIDVSTCVNRRCIFGKYDADFEDGWGMWVSGTNPGLIPWALNSYFTKTMNTGPRGDHTLQGRGNYVYVESSGHQKGDKAWLFSKILEFATPQCMSYYYSMYGELTGSLTLYLAPEGKPWIRLFTKTGNQGPNWQNADVTLDCNGKFKLVFQVELGGKGYSDTALDDIFIDNKACPGYAGCKDDNTNCPFWANNNQCGDNPTYMLENCKLSCKVCTKPNVPQTEAPKQTKAPKITAAPKNCEDEDSNCFSWSTTEQCQNNKNFMHVKCKASCGLCGDCGNLESSIKCDTWAKQGQCNINSSYMMAYCKQSCTGCTKACVDDNVECPGWAKVGECKNNAVWMGVNCRKSCGKC